LNIAFSLVTHPVSHILTPGDHLQLRPKVANYDLSVENLRQSKHNLDVSLFERLCFGGVPSESGRAFKFPLAQLTVQRRMRSEIADLVRVPLYKNLLDHESVHAYPPVAGMYSSLYWLDHRNYEDGANPLDSKETSRSNSFEAQMATELVSHLFKQDEYKNGDVAVITPYLGQLRKLRDCLSKTFTVDLSETDQDELAQLESDELDDKPKKTVASRKRLLENVRIATVRMFQC
jgi:hypothetical protein